MGERSVPMMVASGNSSPMSLNWIRSCCVNEMLRRKEKVAHMAQIPVPVPRSRTFCSFVNK